VNYSDVDSDWHLHFFAPDYSHTVHNSWEHFSTGSLLNLSSELVLNCLLRRSFFNVLSVDLLRSVSLLVCVFCSRVLFSPSITPGCPSGSTRPILEVSHSWLSCNHLVLLESRSVFHFPLPRTDGNRPEHATLLSA
jgi:hypothetical protein